MGFRLVPSNLTLDDPEGSKVNVKILSFKISQTATDTRLDLYVGPTGFRLAPSDLTLDDLEGSKIQVILFDVNMSLVGFVFR